jgi:EmrB/QacA subfamily drug resistance transporter
MTSEPARRERLDPQLTRLGLVLVLGIVMSMLDTTIVNVALRTLGRDLHAGLSTIQWVVTGYLLALAVVIPTTGWAVDRFGAKRLFVTATGLFAASSALCALAWNVQSLIGFRVLQGMAGALLMPVAQTVLARAAGPDRMGRVMMVVGVPALLAPIFGPVLGGLIVDHLSWRWIFLVNVPVGVLSMLVSIRQLPADRPAAVRQGFDFGGLALMSPGLALLVYGLSRAGATGSFASTRAWLTMLAGVLLLALFVWYARTRGERALIPLAYFRDRAFASATAVTLVISLSVFGVMLLLPLYYQQIRHQDALHAGLLLAPQGLGTALAMPIAGIFTDRIGARRVVLAGMALVTVGTIVLTQVSASTSYWLLAATLVVRGLGFGATMMPAMAAGYRNLPASAAGHASTVLQIFSRVGGTLGAALMAVILAQQISAETSAGGGAPANPSAAYGTTFWWATAITAAGVLFALLLPGKAAGTDPTDAGRTPDQGQTASEFAA